MHGFGRIDMGIGIDLSRAKEIKRDELRILRGPELEKLDKEFMKALENNDVARQEQITARKNALRDAPDSPIIDQAQSLQELDAITLETVTGGPPLV